MKGTRRILAWSLALVVCLTLVVTVQSDPPDWANPDAKPIWEIAEAVWEDYADNPRFAVYDAGTLGFTGDDVVLDKETGLVWARHACYLGTNQWQYATVCARGASLANRWGWRLPTIEELLSLMDPSQQNPEDPENLALPVGHPFVNVQPDYYWSSTTRESDSSRAWVVNVNNGHPGNAPKTHEYWVWAVRGGNGYATGNW